MVNDIPSYVEALKALCKCKKNSKEYQELLHDINSFEEKRYIPVYMKMLDGLKDKKVNNKYSNLDGEQ